jgi:hypothetical protein
MTVKRLFMATFPRLFRDFFGDFFGDFSGVGKRLSTEYAWPDLIALLSQKSGKCFRSVKRKNSSCRLALHFFFVDHTVDHFFFQDYTLDVAETCRSTAFCRVVDPNVTQFGRRYRFFACRRTIGRPIFLANDSSKM